MATPYTFSQPIRYYKANDPYYYEVDNIPLRQLEENVLYVKNLIEGFTGGPGDDGGGTGGNGGNLLNEGSELDITNIKQLRPKSIGGRSVQVNAGRFVSRINDAFDISKPLNELMFNAGAPILPNVIADLKQNWDTTKRDEVWDSFIGTTNATNAYNINGLEYTHTFYSTPGGLGSNWGWEVGTPPTGEGSENYPKYQGIPMLDAIRWPGQSNYNALSHLVFNYLLIGSGYNFNTLPSVNLAFVQMWRGVFRTAVVEFPETRIQVPAWNDDDFYYNTYDSQGNIVKTQLDATQRIDLLVAYSLPIDASSTTLPNYESNFCTGNTPTPQTITAPVLGIVKGASIGIGPLGTTQLNIATAEGCTAPGDAGTARLAANKSDNSPAANYGITRPVTGVQVHGSFPSPDDLLNIAPLLALDVESDDFQLIGQAALPLAYIVTTKGRSDIAKDDIIDIRPFLRTTEFTYNERAGIAAANPPLSFANPAVGAFQLQSVVDALNAGGGGNGGNGGGGGTPAGEPLYTDYVMGGLAYGVEGTLLTMCDGVQEAEDPFGTVTTTTTAYIDPPTGDSYSFANYTSSKNYLEDSTLKTREAYLQYVYNMRQGDLKRWLSDPNSSYSQNTGTYLGLPAGNTGRNIPLFPEWDMPMDGTNYLNLMNSTTGAQVPKVTWWMWFEAQANERPISFVPGGVVSYVAPKAGLGISNLNKQYGFGWGSDYAGGFINICSKRLEITFPSWVVDYDVLVSYVNCSPVTSAGHGAENRFETGFGGGLSINKGPVVTYPGGERKAVFQINSAAQNLPERDAANPGLRGMVENGKITDKTDSISPEQAVPEGRGGFPIRTFEWLSYTVGLPQFRNNSWGTSTQGEPVVNTERYVPKFGAAYYPTVKFTIIGYRQNSVTSNTDYNSSNNYTLLQSVTAGDASNLLSVLGPLMADPGTGTNVNSRIDIQNM